MASPRSPPLSPASNSLSTGQRPLGRTGRRQPPRYGAAQPVGPAARPGAAGGGAGRYPRSVGIYRELAAARPDAFRPDLASSLNNLAADLGALGRRDEALDAIQEAVTIRRELASRWPDAYRQELEQSLQAAARLEHGKGHSDSVPWHPKA